MNNDFNSKEIKILAVLIGIILALILGVNLLWAVVIHGNWRCAFTQCRIITTN